MTAMNIILSQSASSGRVFGLDMQTLFDIGIQLLNAVVLAVALGYILYKPVLAFLNKRTNTIQGKIDTAEQTMETANNLIIEYEKKIANVEKERIQILEQAHLENEEAKKVIVDQGREEAALIKKKAIESMELEKNQFLESSKTQIVDLAFLIAEKYMIQTMNSGDLNSIFDETLSQLEEATWKN